MDTANGVTALLGIILGALLGGVGRIFFDYYQRKQEQRGIAAAIAGEVSGIIYEVRSRNVLTGMEDLIEALDSEEPPSKPWLLINDRVDTPVANAYFGQLGKLGVQAAEKVSHWYALHSGFDVEIKYVLLCDDPREAAQTLRSAKIVWEQLEMEGHALVDELHALGGYT